MRLLFKIALLLVLKPLMRKEMVLKVIKYHVIVHCGQLGRMPSVAVKLIWHLIELFEALKVGVAGILT